MTSCSPIAVRDMVTFRSDSIEAKRSEYYPNNNRYVKSRSGTPGSALGLWVTPLVAVVAGLTSAFCVWLPPTPFNHLANCTSMKTRLCTICHISPALSQLLSPLSEGTPLSWNASFPASLAKRTQCFQLADGGQ